MNNSTFSKALNGSTLIFSGYKSGYVYICLHVAVTLSRPWVLGFVLSTILAYSLRMNCRDYKVTSSIYIFVSRTITKRQPLPVTRAAAGQDNNKQPPNGRHFYTKDENAPEITDDWRQFRAKLVASEHPANTPKGALQLGPGEWWAHEICAPEKGCLLLARREDLGVFSYSVVLLTENEPEYGTSGLILNSPTRLHVQQLGLDSESINASFGGSHVFFGGPVATNLLHVVHGHREVAGTEEVLDGVFAGGVDSAAELVQKGMARSHEFRVMAGYCSWAPGQLRAEVENNTWWVVAASKQLILDCINEVAVFSPILIPNGKGIEAARQLDEHTKAAAWERILRCAGIRLTEDF